MLTKSTVRKFSVPVNKREGTTPEIVRGWTSLLNQDQLKFCLIKAPLEDLTSCS